MIYLLIYYIYARRKYCKRYLLLSCISPFYKFQWEFRIEERGSSGEKQFVGRSSFLQSRSLGNKLTQKEIIAHYTVADSIIYFA